MRMDTRVAKGALAIALAAVVVVPVAAWAVPGRAPLRTPKANSARSAVATARLQARNQLLQDRIANALANRARGFDRVASRIGTRIDDVVALASKADLAGGDVSGVSATLDQARTAFDAAKAAEAKAVDMFKAVPATTDHKAAFTAAREQARMARNGLADARALLRSAILKLEANVTGLIGAAQ